MIILIKIYVVLLLLVSLLFCGGFIMVIDDEDFPSWAVVMYLVGISLVIIM